MQTWIIFIIYVILKSQKSSLLAIRTFAYYSYVSFYLVMQIVILKASIHCQGCARKVKKAVSKLEGELCLYLICASRNYCLYYNVYLFKFVSYNKLWCCKNEQMV